jgi:hypothetical protein
MQEVKGRQEAGSRRQEAGGRKQEAGSRRQEAGGRRQEAGGRRQEAGSRRQEAGGRRQEQDARRNQSPAGRTIHKFVALMVRMQLPSPRDGQAGWKPAESPRSGAIGETPGGAFCCTMKDCAGDGPPAVSRKGPNPSAVPEERPKNSPALQCWD